jgi:tetratricopeptide (TPR) repeat protein
VGSPPALFLGSQVISGRQIHGDSRGRSPATGTSSASHWDRTSNRIAPEEAELFPATQISAKESGSGVMPLAVTAERDSAALIAKVNALSDAGRYGEALALVTQGLSDHPGDAELLCARASVWFDWGRIREAYTGFLQAEAGGLSRIALYLNLAWSCQLLGMANEAEAYARKAIALDPANEAAHFGLGTILQREKHFPEAIACFERALELSPDHSQAAAGIARCKLEQHEYAGAEGWMRRAVELAPESSQFRINLAAAMANQERYAESLNELEHAANLEAAQGVAPTSMIDTGFALVSTGEYSEALDVFRKNLPELPDPRAHGYYAFLLLNQGYLREGWTQYEFRWMQEPYLSKRPDCPQPQWAGQNLAGKTVLVLAEQGVGDIVNFARFAVPLKAMGARVLLQARPELLQLARGFDGVDVAFAPPTPPPPFDYHIALMSLPRVLGIDLTTIPADVPYVRVAADKTRAWLSRIDGDGLKVGLAWAGNPQYPRDKFRSIAFDRLSGLWDVQGVKYFSLQKPLKEGELEKFPPGTTLANLAPELIDFTDTAAAIAGLDLVICVDTAVAHLAGAMGKPVWLMLPQIGDFRWLEEREDSPWYPTMRIFRQRVLGEWDEVVLRVKAALHDVVRMGSLTCVAAVQPPPSNQGDLAASAETSLLERTIAADPKNIARVAETRYGILQYLPELEHSAQSIAWYGEYLQPQLELIARLISPGAHVVEAGSGIGEHAIALAKMVGAQGHLLAYETRPVVQRILRQNIEVNRIAGIVTLMRRDLGGPQAGSDVNGQAISDDAPAPAANDPEGADTVDALLLARLELLKIRSEANAGAILDGATETLWRLRPVIFASVGDALAVQKLAEKVRAFGYRCWRVETPFFNSDNYHRREADIFDGEGEMALLAMPEEVEIMVALDSFEELTEESVAGHASSRSPDPQGPADAGALDNGEQGLLQFLRKLLR